MDRRKTDRWTNGQRQCKIHRQRDKQCRHIDIHTDQLTDGQLTYEDISSPQSPRTSQWLGSTTCRHRMQLAPWRGCQADDRWRDSCFWGWSDKRQTSWEHWGVLVCVCAWGGRKLASVLFSFSHLFCILYCFQVKFHFHWDLCSESHQ